MEVQVEKILILKKLSLLDMECFTFVAKKISKEDGRGYYWVLVKYTLPSVQTYLWILSLGSWNSLFLSFKQFVDCRWY